MQTFMNVVFVCENFPPVVCGVGDYTFQLAKEYAQNGHVVHVFCKKNNEVEAEILRGAFGKITVHAIVNNWQSKGYDTVFSEIKKIKPDWVVLQYVPYGFDFLGMPFGICRFARQIKRANFKFFVFFHEIRIGFKARPKTFLVATAQHFIAHFLAKKADKIGTSIDWYANVLRRWQHKLTLIPIGSNIFLDKNRTKEQLLALKKSIFSPENFVVITFGNRDLKAFLPVFDAVFEKNINLRWLICGKNDTPSVFFEKKNYAHRTGILPLEKIADYIALADVFFMPDYVSPKGDGGTCTKSGSLAAAFALEKPVIGVNGCITNELLKNDDNLILLPFDNQSEALESELTDLMHNPDRRKRLGQNARLTFETHLDWSKIYEKYDLG